jgi:hypothetical protein
MGIDWHVPTRPTWLCRCCGAEWPCEVAKARLRREYAENPVSVALYVSSQYAAASVDLPTMPAGMLYARMFSWIRSATAEPGD